MMSVPAVTSYAEAASQNAFECLSVRKLYIILYHVFLFVVNLID